MPSRGKTEKTANYRSLAASLQIEGAIAGTTVVVELALEIRRTMCAAEQWDEFQMDYEGTNGNFEQDNAGTESAANQRASLDGARVITLAAGADNVVVLPADASLDSIRAMGRDLVIEGADGTIYIIPEGAIDVPLIVVDGVAVPPMNLAALLVGAQPDAGPEPGAATQSSGGNFADPVGDIQDAYGLGDLLPYTELSFPEQQEEEIIPYEPNLDPEIVVVTPENPQGAVNASAIVSEVGLPPREGETGGTGEMADGDGSNNSDTSETTAGTIVFNAPDGAEAVLINDVEITEIGQTFVSPFGTLTITSIDLPGGEIGFTYTLADNLEGITEDGFFTVTVRETDGDEASGTLQIDVVDDEPVVAPDVDTVAAGTYGPIAGNVITGEGTDTGAAGLDLMGADGGELTSIAFGETSVDLVEGSAVIEGAYGELTINADGSYSYVRAPGTPGGVSEEFEYTVTDGDGDSKTTTLTINIGDLGTNISIVPNPDGGTIVDEEGLPPREGDEPAGSGEIADGDAGNNSDTSETTTGTITWVDGDDPNVITIEDTVVTGAGQEIPVEGGTLTIISYDPDANVIEYSYTLDDNTSGDDTSISFTVTVTDVDNDSATDTVTINIVDDVPTAVADTDSVTEDGPLVADGNVMTDAEANGDDGADTPGADGASVTGVAFGAPVDADTDGAFDAVSGSVGATVAGAYGELTLDAQGNYVYTLDNTNEYVQGLDATESLTEVFTYTITDGDGDTSTTSLTITINGADDIVTINGLDLDAPELTFDEDDLSDGSSPDATALTQSGTFTVDSPDGLETLTVGGETVFGAGVTYPVTIDDSAYGILTITGVTPTLDANGDVVSASIDYSYTLDDNSLLHDVAGQDSFVDSFEVVATDTDGSNDTASLDIEIVDDVPTAEDDADSLTEGGPTSTSGNLITDAEANGDNGADTPGADGAVVQNAGSYDLTYGSLVVDADGGYTYTLTAYGVSQLETLTDGESFVETFDYVLVDGDGDTDGATLTITLNGTDDIVTVYGLDNDAPEVVLDEDDLANIGDDQGSDQTDPLTLDGNFGVTSPDGLDDVQVNGVDVVVDGAFVGAVEVANDGVYSVTITGWTPTFAADGVTVIEATFSYEATLLDNTLAHDEAGQDSIINMLTVTADDVDGSNDSAVLEVEIVDDVPTARPDTDSVTEGALTSGDVDLNDTFGADGAQVTGVAAGDVAGPVAGNLGGLGIPGLYGTLILNADGTYTYESNPDAVTAPGAEDVFTYTITDGDGDTSTTTLTIDIADVTLTPDNVDVTVYENALDLAQDGDDLAAGNATGSESSDTTETVTGQLNVAGAVNYTLDSFTGNNGVFELNPDGSYTYTLTDPVDGPTADNADNTFNNVETVSYTATDADGNTVQGTITIDVVDDVPTARPDTDSVDEGASTSGDVDLNDTFGADGAQVTGVAAGDVAGPVAGNLGGAGIPGLYGTLILNADGTYTYQANPNVGDGVDVFTYTITDGDGDTSTTTLTIDVDAITFNPDNQDVSVNEAALDLAQDGDDLAAGNATGSTPGETTETVTGQLAVVGAVSYSLDSFTGNNGVFELNPDGSYTYTLTDPLDGPTADNSTNTFDNVETVTYTATDINGNTVQGTITIDVIDDVPTARPDTDSVTEGASTSGDVDLNDTFGADGAQVTGVVAGDVAGPVAGNLGGLGIPGLYGTLILNADGTYTYESNPDAVTAPGAEDVFTYTITDGDGDTSTTTLTIDIADVTLTPDNDDVTVYENALDLAQDGDDLAAGNATGSESSDTTETVTGQLNVAGAVNYTLDSFTGNNGVFELNPDGSYTYTLTDPVDGPTADNSTNTFDNVETVSYTATDADGNTVQGTITIDVVDDVPTARPDTDSVDEGASTSGDVDLNDTFGADGAQVTGVAAGDVAGPVAGNLGGLGIPGLYGTLILNADGTYTYESNPDAVTAPGAEDVFTYTITDGDGDTSTTTLTIDIADVTLTPDNDTVTVYEAALDLNEDGDDLAAGNATGSTPGETTETVTGQLNVTGAVNYTLDSFTGNNGVFELNLDGSYTYTLTDPVDGPTLNNGVTTELGVETVNYTATDADGNSVQGTITVNVVDDIPSIDVTEGANENGLVLFTEDAETIGAAFDFSTSSANFGGLFGLDFDTGADGAVTPTLSFDLNVENSVSDLTSNGDAINLYELADGTIIGSTAGSNPGSVDASVVFSVSVSGTGVVTLTQYQQVDHAILDDPSATEAPFDDQSVLLADGKISLTASSSITDGDGDQASDSETIDLGGNLEFKDDGPSFTSASPGTGVTIDETTAGSPAGFGVNGISATSAGAVITAVGSFGADGEAASDATTYGLELSGGGATLLTTTVGGYAITLVETSDTVITGTYNDGAVQEAFTLEINADGTLTVTQFVALDHPNAANPNDPVFLVDGLGESLVNATITLEDFDGDTATETAAIGDLVTFLDDGPDAVNDGNLGSFDDNSNAVYVGEVSSLLGNDSFGADGEGATPIVIGAGDQGGTMAIVGTSLYYTSGTNITSPYASVNETFTYTITDGDGDQDTATFSVTITDGGPLIADTAATVVVDEDGLQFGIAGGDGDVAGENVTQTGNLAGLNFGVDGAGDIELLAVSDTGLNTLSGNNIASVWDASTHTLTGYDATADVNNLTAADIYFTATITNVATGAYSFTLTQPVQHTVADTEDNQDFLISVLVTDAEGEGALGTMSISIDDDSPIDFSPVDHTDTNDSTVTTQDDSLMNTGSATASGLINDGDNDGIGTNFIGADGFGGLTFTGGTDGVTTFQNGSNVNITSGGDTIYLFGFGTDTLVGSTDQTNVDGTAVVFEISLDEGTGYGADASYSIEFFKTLDDGSGFELSDFSAIRPNQYDWVGFTEDGSLFDNTINNSFDILITSNHPSDGSAGTVNMSSTDIGANNQWMGTDEALRLDFVLDGSGAGDEKTPQGYDFVEHYDVNNASFTIVQLKGGGLADVTVKLYNDDDTGTKQDLDGSTVNIDVSSIVITDINGVDITAGTTINDNGDGTVTILDLDAGDVVSFDGEADFNAFEVIHAGGGDFSLGGFGFNSAVAGSNVDFSFDVLATDADGDTSTGTIDFVMTPAAAPIVLDMDLANDNELFSDMSAGVAYDYNGDGVKAQTAWIAAGAAILAYDANGDQTVTDASEFVFGGDGMTDLQAVAALYDSNADGVLDASDEAYGKFGVWIDADLDGVSDAGEFVSLEDAGIASIDLVSDGNSFADAGGDVFVYGTASYTTDDGQVGTVADAAFAIGADVDPTMDALLALAEGEASKTTGDVDTKQVALDTVEDAMGDVAAEQAIDAIVEHFAGNDTHTQVVESHFAGHDLLDIGLNNGPIMFKGALVADAGEDAHALAATA